MSNFTTVSTVAPLLLRPFLRRRSQDHRAKGTYLEFEVSERPLCERIARGPEDVLLASRLSAEERRLHLFVEEKENGDLDGFLYLVFGSAGATLREWRPDPLKRPESEEGVALYPLGRLRLEADFRSSADLLPDAKTLLSAVTDHETEDATEAAIADLLLSVPA